MKITKNKITFTTLLVIATVMSSIPLWKGPTFVSVTTFPNTERILGGYPLHIWETCPQARQLAEREIEIECFKANFIKVALNTIFCFSIFLISWLVIARVNKKRLS